jgi:hypothetical protein
MFLSDWSALMTPQYRLPCTAKKKYRHFETNNPRKGISGSQSQFQHHVCVSVSDLRGVLGNKCAGHHNLKTVKIRETM